MKKKNMDYYEAKVKHNLSAFGDVDKDGVKNVMDCKPYDPNRDGLFGRAVHVITGGRAGQSKKDYVVERDHRRAERIDLKREETKAYKREYKKARIERAGLKGKEAGSMSISDRFNTAAKQINIKPYSTTNNYNPWGTMFDTGMTTPKRRTSSKKYVIKGGKAYPIAGATKKKKRKGKINTGLGSFDMMDNWGI